jgi:hypothetical protein
VIAPQLLAQLLPFSISQRSAAVQVHAWTGPAPISRRWSARWNTDRPWLHTARARNTGRAVIGRTGLTKYAPLRLRISQLTTQALSFIRTEVRFMDIRLMARKRAPAAIGWMALRQHHKRPKKQRRRDG